jgi:hypothetical protein
MRKDFSDSGADFMTDFRAIPQLLGEKGAWFFGYRWLDATHFVLPDREEINGAIRAYNSGLDPNDERYLPGYFFNSDTSFGTVDENIEKFASAGGVPWSQEGAQFLHDVTGHALEGFWIARSLWDIAQLRTRIWLEFVESLPPVMATQFAAGLEKVSDRFSNQIDGLGQGERNLMSAADLREMSRLAESERAQLKASANFTDEEVEEILPYVLITGSGGIASPLQEKRIYIFTLNFFEAVSNELRVYGSPNKEQTQVLQGLWRKFMVKHP